MDTSEDKKRENGGRSEPAIIHTCSFLPGVDALKRKIKKERKKKIRSHCPSAPSILLVNSLTTEYHFDELVSE